MNVNILEWICESCYTEWKLLDHCMLGLSDEIHSHKIITKCWGHRSCEIHCLRNHTEARCSLRSDRGRCVSSNIVKGNQLCYISHLLMNAYHPQTNSLKIKQNMLSMYVETEQRNWDTILSSVTFAYNCPCLNN